MARKPMLIQKMTRHLVTLPPSMVEHARKLGNGNLSQGIRDKFQLGESPIQLQSKSAPKEQ